MVRDCRRLDRLQRSSPHPRGDGPDKKMKTQMTLWFSPPAWGWSGTDSTHRSPQGVLPTRVGMVRPAPLSSVHQAGSPHPRGDGPLDRSTATAADKFSPPAWGWSAFDFRTFPPSQVLPTRVGMVRYWQGGRAPKLRSPHPRGDGPCRDTFGKRPVRFSPPAWGWSAFPRMNCPP